MNALFEIEAGLENRRPLEPREQETGNRVLLFLVGNDAADGS